MYVVLRQLEKIVGMPLPIRMEKLCNANLIPSASWRCVLIVTRGSRIIEVSPYVLAMLTQKIILHTYVPDFQVWRWDGLVEIHEVTLSERRLLPNAQRREKAAQEYCDNEGWRYVVHTEGSLPNDTEGANLLALYAYRPSIYSRADVSHAVIEKFGIGQHILLRQLISAISQDLDLPLCDCFHCNLSPDVAWKDRH